MRYKCLVLDHDDTVVNSTATVHFQCFSEYMRRYYPSVREYTLEEYFMKNFDPGVIAFYRDELGIEGEALKAEQEYWNEYVQTHIPKAYDGIRELLWKQKESGGYLCVVSQSYKQNILRDYCENDLPEPDLVYGFELPNELRKPHPHAMREIMKRLNVKNTEMLMLDDSKPGYIMAQAVNVPFAAAGWAYDIPVIQSFMRNNSEHFFESVQAFYQYQFGNEEA